MLVWIEENFHYSEKEEYIVLIKSFLRNDITVENFSTSFMGIYEGIFNEIRKMEKEESPELLHFLEKKIHQD